MGQSGRDLEWRKSSYCDHNNCVEWAISSYCSADADCVEWSKSNDSDKVLVRDSKNPDGPVLHFTLDEWKAFVLGVKAGEFDI